MRVIAPPLLSFGRTSVVPAFRLSSALSPARQQEGAVSLGITHQRSGGRIEAFVERRFSIAKRGRDAFGAGIAGGGEVQLESSEIILRSYGQAGVVGVRRLDLYVDGALSAERAMYRSKDVDVAIGAGGWGEAQPDLSRFDIGPFAAVTARVSQVPIRTTLGWRFRVAGNAAPSSGPAVTIGADF